MPLGDIADIRQNKQAVPDKAQAASQQAVVAASNLSCLLRGKRLKKFRYLELGDMLTLGINYSALSSFFIKMEGFLVAIIRRLVYVERLPTMRHKLQGLEAFID